MAESHDAADMDVINAVSNVLKPNFSPLDLHLLAKCKATERDPPYRVVMLAHNSKCLFLRIAHVTAQARSFIPQTLGGFGLSRLSKC